MNVYPSVTPGQISVRSPTWPFDKSDEWSTVKQVASSGKEVRLALWTFPRWHWVIDYSYLYDDPANLGTNTYTDFRTIMGLHLQSQGVATPFLFDDPTNDTILDSARQNFGTGDGTTATFQLVNNIGGFLEPVQAPAGVGAAPAFAGGAAPLIYVNGVLQTVTTDYTIGAVGYGGGVVTFTSGHIPSSGLALTWSGNWYYPATFEEDRLDASERWSALWELKEVKLVSVKY
jgi:uncharacterized protein (TIGR02217 family)